MLINIAYGFKATSEQTNLIPYSALLDCNQVHRAYLNELGNIRDLPIWIALMVLTTLEENQAPTEARYLLQRSQSITTEQPSSRAIIELVTTIMVYRFESLTQKEVEAMLGITLQETRVYRDVKAEGLEEGLLQGLERGLV